MQQRVAITFIGDDRPGLIETISRAVNTHGGNWLESRMANLAGKFAGIALVALPADNLAALESELQHLDTRSIRVLLEPTSGVTTNADALMSLAVLGNDRPGIVRELTNALAQRDINVVEMRSDITSAPMTGEALFTASARIELPAGIDLDELTDALDDIANELTIEYTLEDS